VQGAQNPLIVAGKGGVEPLGRHAKLYGYPFFLYVETGWLYHTTNCRKGQAPILHSGKQSFGGRKENGEKVWISGAEPTLSQLFIDKRVSDTI
jgi:hypothetical protein